MRFAVEAWAPEYGAPVTADELEPSQADVDVAVELPANQWRPLRPDGVAPARVVRFVDGVRRVDARVWITGGDGAASPGIAASYAAGVVVCDGAARLQQVQVRRGLFASAPSMAAIATRHGEYHACVVAGDGVEQLSLGLQQRMGALEALVATSAGAADLLVVDGPLNKLPDLDGLKQRSGRPTGHTAVGYVKTHRRSYLPPELSTVVAALDTGERTPLFVSTAQWSRYSWYVRLPGSTGHPWAGIVRCEASGDVEPAAARRLADLATATLPRYASTAPKDPRAPQNLHPIGELERALRRRLGDPGLLLRSLRRAAG